MTKPTIPVSYDLMQRILTAFLDMQGQGAKCKDENLMRDLDRELARHDR